MLLTVPLTRLQCPYLGEGPVLSEHAMCLLDADAWHLSQEVTACHHTQLQELVGSPARHRQAWAVGEVCQGHLLACACFVQLVQHPAAASGQC